MNKLLLLYKDIFVMIRGNYVKSLDWYACQFPYRFYEHCMNQYGFWLEYFMGIVYII